MIALKVLELKVHRNRNLVGILNESDYDDKGWHLIIHKIYRIYNELGADFGFQNHKGLNNLARIAHYY